MVSRSIARAKLAVTSCCNLRCVYCLIDKSRGEKMSLPAACQALEKIIASPGASKTIGIYGGEPLLLFPLVRAIISRAQVLKRRCGKTVHLSLATNGLLLNAQRLRFFREEGVHLCVSINGLSNDRLRIRGNGQGTLHELESKLALVFQLLSRRQVTALQGIHPEHAAGMRENFLHLLSLGFRNVNLEMIQGPAWDAGSRGSFTKGFAYLRAELLRKAETSDPLFLQSVNRRLLELAHPREGGATAEFIPCGGLAASPYPFLHVSGADRFLRDGREMLRLRQALSWRLADELTTRSRARPSIRRYIREAVELGRAH